MEILKVTASVNVSDRLAVLFGKATWFGCMLTMTGEQDDGRRLLRVDGPAGSARSAQLVVTEDGELAHFDSGCCTQSAYERFEAWLGEYGDETRRRPPAENGGCGGGRLEDDLQMP